MSKNLNLRIWGTRGSFPAPDREYMVYGGNTVCSSLALEDRILVLDAGSGLAMLGKWLSKEKRYRQIDLFFSHLHLDHIIGLLNFQPFYDSEMKICLYGERRDGHSLESMLNSLLCSPWWPVGFSGFQAKLDWREVKAGEDYTEPWGLRFTAFRANHPDRGLLYRMELEGRKLMYGLDCEMDETIWDGLVSFSEGCDLLVCDGQFEEKELEEKKGWGHSSWEQAVRLRQAAKAGKVLVTHYGWECSDKRLMEWERAALRTDRRCIFAREGMEVEI